MGSNVRFDHVTKEFKVASGVVVRAAVDVTFELAGGSTAALVGASGSGKSTLLHMLGAMDKPDSGAIVVDGEDITTFRGSRAAAYRAGIGIVFQKFHLVKAFSVLQNVLAPIQGRRRRSAATPRAMELLDFVGLAARADSPATRLSGGEQQRVAIARALVSEPGLLLADEPTGNLDSANAAQILALLRQVHETFQPTIVIATHDPVVADTCSSRLTMRDGEMECVAM